MVNQKINYDGPFSRYKLAIHNICHQAILYHRSVYDERLYDVDYRLFADYVLIFNRGEISVLNLCIYLLL